MITKIFTVRDAIEQNRAAKEARTHALQVRELT